MKGLRLGVLVVAAALVGGLTVWIGLRSREARSESKERAEAVEQEPESKRTPGVVRLDSESRKRADIQTQAPAPYSLQPQIIAYGRLEEDPSRSFTVRAPLAGTLLAGDSQTWPALGRTIPDEATIGLIEPRRQPTKSRSPTSSMRRSQSCGPVNPRGKQLAWASNERAFSTPIARTFPIAFFRKRSRDGTRKRRVGAPRKRLSVSWRLLSSRWDRVAAALWSRAAEARLSR